MTKEIFATFPIFLSPELRDKLVNNTAAISEAQATGDAPSYPKFVDKLFNHMNSTEECLMHACTGLSTEGGEALDCAKAYWIYQKPLDQRNLVEELGDVRFYYQQCLNMIGMSDEDIIASNMEKLKKRYPDGEYSNFHAAARLDKE